MSEIIDASKWPDEMKMIANQGAVDARLCTSGPYISPTREQRRFSKKVQAVLARMKKRAKR